MSGLAYTQPLALRQLYQANGTAITLGNSPLLLMEAVLKVVCLAMAGMTVLVAVLVELQHLAVLSRALEKQLATRRDV
jgi:hypothetical protein